MNYFEYFSEIEQRFSQRRGSILLLSTLDWALIETWREAGIPLEAVLRGIDNAFDKHDARSHRARSRFRKVNGLAWCAQAVMHATEEMVDAATGLHSNTAGAPASRQDSGFEPERVAVYLDQNAHAIEAATTPAALLHERSSTAESLEEWPGSVPSEAWVSAAMATATRLRELAMKMRSVAPLPLDELDRTLTILEERLFAALQSSATEQELVDLRAHAERELAPYRTRISASQFRQVQAQFLQKRLLEVRGLPRLSLFYMRYE